MVCSALLEPKVVHINILQFMHEKVIIHGSIAFPINSNIMAGFIFEEILTNDYLCP